MDNKTENRLQKLAFLLKQMDKIHVKDAATILNVSEMTIRRDLNSDTGSIVLLGGYIVNNPHLKNENKYFIFEQESKNIAEKMHIGKVAANLIEEDDVVFFDCGSTIPFIASQINLSVKFTALCCSINTFMVLQENPNCDVILCGGRYSRHNSFLTSLQHHSELDTVCTTKAFISAAGVDAKQGVTCFDFDEAKTKQKAMAKSQQNILVFDSLKINKVQHAYVADLTQFDLLICNQELPDSFAKGINLLIK